MDINGMINSVQDLYNTVISFLNNIINSCTLFLYLLPEWTVNSIKGAISAIIIFISVKIFVNIVKAVKEVVLPW